MLLHVYSHRKNDGGIQIGLGDECLERAGSFCSNNPQSILLPDPIFIETGAYHLLKSNFATGRSWGERNPKAFWRGSTTGRPVTTWRTLPRAILCEIGLQNDDLFDCGITHAVQGRTPEETNEILHSDLMRSFVKPAEFSSYRFHIDIDGNSNSWPGFFSKLLSGGAVFKVNSLGDYRQWYYSRLVPWTHYIPVHSDMRDLIEKVQWARAHMDFAQKIGAAGQCLAESMTIAKEMGYAVGVIDASLA